MASRTRPTKRCFATHVKPVSEPRDSGMASLSRFVSNSRTLPHDHRRSQRCMPRAVYTPSPQASQRAKRLRDGAPQLVLVQVHAPAVNHIALSERIAAARASQPACITTHVKSVSEPRDSGIVPFSAFPNKLSATLRETKRARLGRQHGRQHDEQRTWLRPASTSIRTKSRTDRRFCNARG
jgi:hypothetical protein